MRLFSNTGLKCIVFSIVFLVSFPSHSAPRCWAWSTIGGSQHPSENPTSAKTKCKLNFSGSASYTCGDTSAQINTEITETDDTGMTIHGVWWEPSWLHNGYNQWDKQYNYSSSLSRNQSSIVSKALKTALEADNCETAQLLFDSLLNPSINEDGTFSFSDGESSCAVTSSGHQSCDISDPPLTCDDNGENCHINIGSKEGTVDDFARAKPKDKDNSNNQDVPGNSNLDQGLDGSGSSGSSSGGSGSSDSGSSGSGSGGSGVGSGEGDGDGKGELPTLEDFNISNSLSKLKAKLKEKINTQSCSVSGECPTITVELFGSSHSIDIHCKIISENGEGIRTGFNFLWTTIAVLIILSA